MSKVVPLLETIFQNKGGSPQLWKATNEVLLTRSDEARHFCAYMKNKVRHMNRDIQLLALDFLDYSIDDGKMPLWTQVSSKDFLTNLVNILKTRDDVDVQNKILYLIEKWGRRFEKFNNIIPNFTAYYKNLKDNGVEFPKNYQSNYHNYVGESYNNNNDNNNNNNNSNSYVQNIKFSLDPNDYEKKYKKLILKLDEMVKYIGNANSMIDNTQIGNILDNNLKDMINEMKEGERLLIETIQGDRLKDEKLMEISLGVTEDIKKTVNRFEDLKRGRNPSPFIPAFNNGDNNNNNNNINNNNNQKTFDIFEGFDNNNNNNNNNNFSNNNNNNQGNNPGTINDLLDIFSNPTTNVNQNQNMNSGMYPQFLNDNNNNSNNNNNNMNMNMFGNNVNMNMNMFNNNVNQNNNNFMNIGFSQNNSMNMSQQNNQNNMFNMNQANNQNNNGMNFNFAVDSKSNNNNNMFDFGIQNNQNQNQFNMNMSTNNNNFMNMGINTNNNPNMMSNNQNMMNNQNMFGNNNGGNNNNNNDLFSMF